MIGSWPGERGARGPSKAPADRYANPRGFIQVTAENKDTPVSEHFKLRDFLTKNQPNVWPKYLVLELRLIDKLELVLSDLAIAGDQHRWRDRHERISHALIQRRRREHRRPSRSQPSHVR